jgi:hypothetical protein
MEGRELTLEFLLVGEAADNANGKLYMMGGGWNQVQSTMFPTVARCGIAVSVLVPKSEDSSPSESILVKISYSDREKTTRLEVEGRIQVGAAPPGARLPDRQRVFFVLNSNFPVPRPGEYEITASLPDGQSKTVSFEASIVAQPTRPIMN